MKNEYLSLRNDLSCLGLPLKVTFIYHKQSTIKTSKKFQRLATKSYTPVKNFFTGSHEAISKLKSLKQILQHKSSISFEISY